MKSIKYKLFSLAILGLFFTSCSSDDDVNPINPDPVDYEKGILVTNEGPFNNGSGTVTYVSEDFATVEQNIYRNVNGKDLGNIVQSLGFHQEDAYIVVNNSQKIIVVNRYSFKLKDTITSGLHNPRYFASNGQTRGYVSNWGDPMDQSDDFVSVIDLRTKDVIATIPVAFGPDKILTHNSKMYVAHIGGFGFNNLISVVSANAVETTIEVGDVPQSMTVVGNYLYVLGSGKPAYSNDETPGTISKIDLNSNEVVETFTFSDNQHPTGLTADGGQLYFNLDGKVYSLNSNAITLPGIPIIDGFFYAMTAKDGKLYATDAGDFASRGRLLVFDLSTNLQIQDFQTGIIPGGIYFNE